MGHIGIRQWAISFASSSILGGGGHHQWREGSIQEALLATGVDTVTNEEVPGITKGIARKY